MSKSESKGSMKKYLIAAVVIIIVVVASVFAYYYWMQKPAGVEEIKIGLLVGLSGTMADVGKTQRDGAVLAILETNEAGGLNMPWGKVKVSYIIKDDETNVDVATRRYWELVEVDKVVAAVGCCWAPILLSLNEQSKTAKVPFGGPAALTTVIKKAVLSPYVFLVMPSAYSIGYSAAAYSISQGWKRIYFLARSDTWGWEMADGVKAAINSLGGELVGLDEAPLGAPDFTSHLLKVKDAKPDVFIFAQFAADQVNVLKQANAMGLKSITKIFAAWITNAVASAVPSDVLEDTYALHYFYWNLTGFTEQEAVACASGFVANFINRFGYPPDSYVVQTYINTKEFLRAIEVAGSTDPDKIVDVLTSKSSQFESPKGPGTWRICHDVIFKYAFYVVQGKKSSERAGFYDLYKVIGYYGGEKVMPPLSSLGYA